MGRRIAVEGGWLDIGSVTAPVNPPALPLPSGGPMGPTRPRRPDPRALLLADARRRALPVRIAPAPPRPVLTLQYPDGSEVRVPVGPAWPGPYPTPPRDSRP